MKKEFLFGVFPYVALALLAVGILIRYVLLRRQDRSVELAQARAVFASGRLWLVSLLLLVAGHLVMVGAPRSLLLWNTHGLRLYLLEIVSFVVGISCLVGWLALMRRNVKRHGVPLLAELSDTVLLALVFVGIFSGLLLALLYRWGSSWGAMVLAPYFASVGRGKPAPGFVVQLPFLVRLHVFSFFGALAVIPATRLGTVIAALLQTVLAALAKPLWIAACAAAAWLRKHNPAPLFWPEED